PSAALDELPVEQVDQHISLARPQRVLPQRVLPQLDDRVAYRAHHGAFLERTILVTARAARESRSRVTERTCSVSRSTSATETTASSRRKACSTPSYTRSAGADAPADRALEVGLGVVQADRRVLPHGPPYPTWAVR